MSISSLHINLRKKTKDVILSLTSSKRLFTKYQVHRPFQAQLLKKQIEEEQKTNEISECTKYEGEEVKRYYDHQRHCSYLYDSLKYNILEIMKQNELERDNTKHVMDIGCGDGNYCRDLARIHKYRRIVGVDNSKDMLSRAYQLNRELPLVYRAIEYVNEHARFLFMPELYVHWQGQFDSIIATHIFNHMTTLTHLRQCIHGISKALKKSYSLFFFFFFDNNKKFEVALHIRIHFFIIYIYMYIDGCLVGLVLNTANVSRQSKEHLHKYGIKVSPLGMQAMEKKDESLSMDSVAPQNGERLSLIGKVSDNENDVITMNVFYWEEDIVMAMLSETGFLDIEWVDMGKQCSPHPSLNPSQQSLFRNLLHDQLCPFSMFVCRKRNLFISVPSKNFIDLSSNKLLDL
ncbi:hypothetical protein RFI_05947 [Reticulomyxa filosa]|uniref:Methyltransferase domain-containing protein n=1 Tax=Reticulomyxa filosa TaxID=46433 RepID=X6NZA6_RETFI|nr:hypothetical protein RFI_05947 [Reticulomyxa filosa]|eukprot:ETO31174.1 hypothetical protein RFI_05947 [Reticulomyxa filosa]